MKRCVQNGSLANVQMQNVQIDTWLSKRRAEKFNATGKPRWVQRAFGPAIGGDRKKTTTSTTSSIKFDFIHLAILFVSYLFSHRVAANRIACLSTQSVKIIITMMGRRRRKRMWRHPLDQMLFQTMLSRQLLPLQVCIRLVHTVHFVWLLDDMWSMIAHFLTLSKQFSFCFFAYSLNLSKRAADTKSSAYVCLSNINSI